MKKLICSMIAYIFISNLLIAQVEEIQISSECENYNYFRNTPQWDTIKQIMSGTYVDGTIYLNQDSTDNLDSLFQRFSLDVGTSFEFEREMENSLDSNKYYRRYRQMYRDIEVEGGGYTIAYIKHNGPGDPTGPCDFAYMLIPFFLNDLDIEIDPTILSSSLDTILDVDSIDYELVISHNLENDCEYNLTWKVSYIDEFPKISYIDAHTGFILSTYDSRRSHNAPTTTYGSNKTLTDKTVGSITSLESPDGTLKVFDFYHNDCPKSNAPENWSTSFIPTTTSTTDWTTESHPNTYQAFWVTTQLLPLFLESDIKFTNVNLASCDNDKATSLDGSTLDDAYITIGILNDKPFALYETIAHELGHTYLNQFLFYSGIGSQTLHEGLSDIIGTYIESKIPTNSGVDWIVADDEPLIAEDESVDRNFETPREYCFTDVKDLLNEHTRCLPLDHWFYLITEGSSGDGIPSLGLNTAFLIVIKSLPMLDKKSDYPDLMHATIKVALDDYGRCSPEFEAVVKAWELICVPTPYGAEVPSCNFTICTSNTVCEEDDYLNICLCDTPISEADFRWTIIGPMSTGFESQIGMFGNVQEGGDCLTLTDFPSYPYYPQYITIELYTTYIDPITLQNFNRIQRKKIKLVDCREDDPTCEEYNSMVVIPDLNENKLVLSTENLVNLDDEYLLRVYDLFGRLIFQGNEMDFSIETNNYNNLLFLVYFNRDGTIINTKKTFLIR